MARRSLLLLLLMLLTRCGEENYSSDLALSTDLVPASDLTALDEGAQQEDLCEDGSLSWDQIPPDFPVLEDLSEVCLPNLDGVIEIWEMPVLLGAQAHFRVNPEGTLRAVEIEGEEGEDGLYTWDMSLPYSDDVEYLVEPLTAEGQWFESSFPGASYVGYLSPFSDILGIYRATESTLDLMGMAAMDSEETLAIYDSPIILFSYPLAVGDQWVSEGVITDGLVQGIPLASRDTYRIEVDGRGTLKLPQITFESVLRLRLEVTQVPVAGTSIRQIQYIFLSECYGEVARITSQVGETDPLFTVAAEVRRLSF